MNKELLLYGEQVFIDKRKLKYNSAQSQVYEGYSLAEREDIVVKQIRLDLEGYNCLIKELQVQ